MKTVIVASIVLAVLGLVGTNEAQMTETQQISDMNNVCQVAVDSYYDGQVHNRPAEDECATRIDEINSNGKYIVTWGDEMPIVTKK